MKISSRYCTSCRRQGPAIYSGPNHVLHLLMTLFTAGFWFPIWLLLTIFGGGWNCQTCGSASAYSSKADQGMSFLLRAFIVIVGGGLAVLTLALAMRAK